MKYLLGSIALTGVAVAVLAAGAVGMDGGQEVADVGPGSRATARSQAPAPSAEPATGPAARRRTSSRSTAAIHDLGRARAIFDGADTDQNGSIDRLESVRAGLSSREFGVFDGDVNGAVSRDEFVVGYRRLVNAAGHRTAPDLDAESTRIEAFRKALQAQTNRNAERGGAGTTEPSGPGARRIYNARTDGEQPPAQDPAGTTEASTEPAVGPAARRRAASQDPSTGTTGRESGEAGTTRGAVPTARPGGGADGATNTGSVPNVRPTPASSRGATPTLRPVGSPTNPPATDRPAGTSRTGGSRGPFPQAQPQGRPAQQRPRPQPQRPRPRPPGGQGRGPQ